MEITGEDKHSSVKSISYQIVKRGEKLDENGKWIAYDGKPVSFEEEMDFVVYAKIVDQDDNEVIVISERAMIEKSAATVRLAPNFTEGAFTNKKDAAIVATVQEGTAALKEIRYVVNGEENTTEETVFGSISDLPDGEYDVIVSAKDILGKEVSAKGICEERCSRAGPFNYRCSDKFRRKSDTWYRSRWRRFRNKGNPCKWETVYRKNVRSD